MRDFIALLFSLAAAVLATSAMATEKIRLAQSSAATNCMMLCNSRAASCQTGCLVPSAQVPIGQLPNGPVTFNNVTPQTNTTASTTCLSACSTTQLACQTTCARSSPSQ
jgi:hypothetical protein